MIAMTGSRRRLMVDWDEASSSGAVRSLVSASLRSI